MKNNFTSEDLVLYLDGALDSEDLPGLKDKLQADPGFREEYKRLELARDFIKLQGLKARVGNIHQEMMQELKAVGEKESATVIPMFSKVMRIAAVFLLVVGGTAIYQYSQLSALSIFEKNYTGYVLPQQRGEPAGSTLTKAYQDGEMDKVTALFLDLKQPTAPDYFYAGNAYLQLDNPQEAIRQFLQLVAVNKINKPTVFEDDTDYFLAMAYLKNGQLKEAETLFEKIHSTTGHRYNDKVSSWLIWKIKHAGNK